MKKYYGFLDPFETTTSFTGLSFKYEWCDVVNCTKQNKFLKVTTTLEFQDAISAFNSEELEKLDLLIESDSLRWMHIIKKRAELIKKQDEKARAKRVMILNNLRNKAVT